MVGIALRRWLFPPVCVACDAPGPALCESCAPGPSDAVAFALDGVPAYALGPYDGALRRAVVAMKRGARDPLVAFGALLDRAPVTGLLVPLPTTAARVRERGFDQATELARIAAGRRGIPCEEILCKRGRPQAGLGRHDRLAAGGRFALRPGAAAPRTATLLDDVCTTGATLRDALAVLRAAGTDVRRIVVLARAEPPATPRGRSGR